MSSVAWADRDATVYVRFQFFLGAVYDERQSNDKHMSEPKGDEDKRYPSEQAIVALLLWMCLYELQANPIQDIILRLVLC